MLLIPLTVLSLPYGNNGGFCCGWQERLKDQNLIQTSEFVRKLSFWTAFYISCNRTIFGSTPLLTFYTGLQSMITIFLLVHYTALLHFKSWLKKRLCIWRTKLWLQNSQWVRILENLDSQRVSELMRKRQKNIQLLLISIAILNNFLDVGLLHQQAQVQLMENALGDKKSEIRKTVEGRKENFRNRTTK